MVIVDSNRLIVGYGSFLCLIFGSRLIIIELFLLWRGSNLFLWKCIYKFVYIFVFFICRSFVGIILEFFIF